MGNFLVLWGKRDISTRITFKNVIKLPPNENLNRHQRVSYGIEGWMIKKKIEEFMRQRRGLGGVPGGGKSRAGV